MLSILCDCGTVNDDDKMKREIDRGPERKSEHNMMSVQGCVCVDKNIILLIFIGAQCYYFIGWNPVILFYEEASFSVNEDLKKK